MKLLIHCLVACHLVHFAAFGDSRVESGKAFENIKAAKALPSTPATWRISQPSESELAAFQANFVQAATNVVYQCETFRTKFPASGHIGEVIGIETDTLYSAFGSGRFPVPTASAEPLYQAATNLGGLMPGDIRLQMTVARVVAALPAEKAVSIYESFIQNNPGEPAKSIAKVALKKLKRVGQPLVLRFNSIDGRAVDLEQYRGKVVILNFWATWCVPCIREMKELQSLVASAPANSVAVIGISLDTGETELKAFLRREKIPWPQYFSPSGAESPLIRNLDVKSIPEVWLIDKQGKLRDVQGAGGLSEKVNGLLTEK